MYIENIKKSDENYSEISNNFLYLKDVAFDSQNSKETFYKYYEINQSLSKVNRLSYQEDGIILEDSFEVFFINLGIFISSLWTHRNL